MPSLSRAFQGLVSLVALPMAAACALAAMAGLGGGLSGWLDIPAQFAPLWMIGGAGATALALFGLPEFPRRAVLIYSAIAVTASAVLIAPEYMAKSSKAPADAPHQVRVIQYNAWGGGEEGHGESLKWLLQEKPDAIVMPEPSTELLDRLREAGYHLSCFDTGNTYCAVAILSLKAPVSRGVVAHRERRSFVPLARAVLPAPGGGTYTVIGAHLVWPTEPRQQSWQRRRLGEVIAQSEPRDRVIVAGDFNSAPWSSARREDDKTWGLERRTHGVFSWPTRKVEIKGFGFPVPFLPIDHIYAGSAWRTVSVKRGPVLSSDHYPVIAVLALAPPAGALRIEQER